VNFFFDNMVSPKLAKMVEVFTAGEHRVSHIREDARFRHATDDQTWITRLANDADHRNIISGDLRMLGNPTIVAEFHRSQLIFFCMDENGCSGNTDHSQVWKFFRIWPSIVAYARGPRPAFYEVSTVKDRPSVDPMRLTRRARRRRLDL
jgi:hypothetical protein